MKVGFLIKSFCVLFFFLIYSNATNILACDCKNPDICSAYSRAEKVFVGKVEKVEYFNSVRVDFSVIKTYKGKTNEIERIEFKDGICLSAKFIEGKEYFVYQDKEDSIKVCNRTTDSISAKKDIEYAESLSITKPSYLIKGFISAGGAISQEELKNVKLYISFGKTKKRVEIDKDGFFIYSAKKRGSYQVNILFPFVTEVIMENDEVVFENYKKINNSSLSTQIQYDLQFKPNECDFRTIGIIN